MDRLVSDGVVVVEGVLAR